MLLDALEKAKKARGPASGQYQIHAAEKSLLSPGAANATSDVRGSVGWVFIHEEDRWHVHHSVCLSELFDSRHHDISQVVEREFCIHICTSADVNFEINSVFNPLSKDSNCGSIHRDDQGTESLASWVDTH
jgi:hypothetical protein